MKMPRIGGLACACLATLAVATACSSTTTTTSTATPGGGGGVGVTAAPSSADKLTVESGFSAGTSFDGAPTTTAGAVISNPSSQAAYDVSVQFSSLGAGDKVLDTQTDRIYYIPAGGKAVAAPTLIGHDAAEATAKVTVSVTQTFKKDTGPNDRGFGGSGAFLEVVSSDYKKSSDSLYGGVQGQVKNSTDKESKFPSVRCVLRGAGAIVGGIGTAITDPIAPGATIAFSAGSLVPTPPAADSAECSITV